MSTPYFRFKQFTIFHDRCAMKVGTDGVLLGCWAGANHAPFGHLPCTILDVGTGSGLIARMLMQRFPEAEVEGIDIDVGGIAQFVFRLQMVFLHSERATMDIEQHHEGRIDLQDAALGGAAEQKRALHALTGQDAVESRVLGINLVEDFLVIGFQTVAYLHPVVDMLNDAQLVGGEPAIHTKGHREEVFHLRRHVVDVCLQQLLYQLIF